MAKSAKNIGALNTGRPLTAPELGVGVELADTKLVAAELAGILGLPGGRDRVCTLDEQPQTTLSAGTITAPFSCTAVPPR